LGLSPLSALSLSSSFRDDALELEPTGSESSDADFDESDELDGESLLELSLELELELSDATSGSPDPWCAMHERAARLVAASVAMSLSFMISPGPASAGNLTSEL